jgi:hypothetical protein
MPEITGDQALMVEHARRLFAPGDGFARVRRAVSNWPEVDGTVWDEFVAKGWLLLLVPEDRGGMGGSTSDFIVLMEGLGPLLSAEPTGSALPTIQLLASCRTQPAEGPLKAALAGEQIALAATEPLAFPLGRDTHAIPDAHWADVLVFGVANGPQFAVRALEVGQGADILSIPERSTEAPWELPRSAIRPGTCLARVSTSAMRLPAAATSTAWAQPRASSASRLRHCGR